MKPGRKSECWSAFTGVLVGAELLVPKTWATSAVASLRAAANNKCASKQISDLKVLRCQRYMRSMMQSAKANTVL